MATPRKVVYVMYYMRTLQCVYAPTKWYYCRYPSSFTKCVCMCVRVRVNKVKRIASEQHNNKSHTYDYSLKKAQTTLKRDRINKTIIVTLSEYKSITVKL